MFCLVDLIEPNFKSNHGPLCVSLAILRYYSRWKVTVAFESIATWTFLQQQCPRDRVHSLFYLDTLKVVLHLYSCFLGQFWRFNAMLKNKIKSFCQLDIILTDRKRKPSVFPLTFLPPSSTLLIWLQGQNQWQEYNWKVKVCAESLTMHMGHDGTAMFHYKFKANLFLGRESRMSR